MSGSPDRGIAKSNKIPDPHQGLTSKRGNENSSPEDVHVSEHDQSCSPDGFPRLSGSNRKRASCSEPASEFWSQGLAKLKALDTRSKGDGKDGDTAALIQESCNPPPETDTAESASTEPRDELHRPRLPFFPKPDIPSATSSKTNSQAQPLPNSSISVSNKIPNIENEQTSLPLGHPLRLRALDVGGVDQSLEVEAKKCRSPTPTNISRPPTESLVGNEYESSKDVDAIPSHTEPVSSTGMMCVKDEDSLPVRPAIQKSEPAMPIDPSSISKTSCLSGDSGLSPPKTRHTLETPSKGFDTPKHSRSSTLSPTSEPFEPPFKTPNTPRRNPRSEHFKSLSADASAGHSTPSSGSYTAPRSYYGHDHQRSVSLGDSSVPSPAPLYPAPKQHTPEGQGQFQGQFFDNLTSMLFPMPAHFPHPISPYRPPFPSSLHSFYNNTIHQNTQVYKQGEQNAEYSQSNHFDSYATSQAANAAPNTADLHQNGNIYTQDASGYGPRYYSNHTDPAHQARLCPLRKDYSKLMKTQLNQNLYSPLEPHREPSKPNQRTAKDMFIPEDLRLKLHARTEATLRVFAGKLLRYRTSQYGFVDIHPSESFSNEHTRRRTLPYPYAFDSGKSTTKSDLAWIFEYHL